MTLLILCAFLAALYKIYEINGNKFAALNINDKNKISVTENNENINNYVNNNINNDILGQSGRQPLFILGERNGKLALYNGDKSEVRRIYDVYISTLPEYDRQELAAGIAVYDLDELASLIEDLTS